MTFEEFFYLFLNLTILATFVFNIIILLKIQNLKAELEKKNIEFSLTYQNKIMLYMKMGELMVRYYKKAKSIVDKGQFFTITDCQNLIDLEDDLNNKMIESSQFLRKDKLNDMMEGFVAQIGKFNIILSEILNAQDIGDQKIIDNSLEKLKESFKKIEEEFSRIQLL